MKDIHQSLRFARSRPRIGILRVANPVKEAETVTIGSVIFEADINAGVTSGNISVDLSAASSLIAASGTLTAASNPANDSTVTIGATTYTFKTALTASTTANEVLIGASASDSLDNLIAAVNKASGGGTTYGSDTVANASVTAAAGAGDTVTVTARVKGTAGNSIATTEVSSQLSFGAATLASGADTSAAEFTTALTAAINANECGGSAVRISANDILFIEANNTANPLATTETLTGSNNAWAAATTYGGENEPLSIPDMCMFSRVPNAAEVALGNLHLQLSFTPTLFIVQVRTTSTGAIRAWDGTVVITDNRLTLAGGTTPLAATETVTVFAAQ